MNLSDLFLQPERLWMLAVVPVLILAYVLATRRLKRTGMRFTNTAVLERVVRKQSQWRRHLAVALSLLSLITLVLAWARRNGVDRVPRERATIVLVIDVSQSMAGHLRGAEPAGGGQVDVDRLRQVVARAVQRGCRVDVGQSGDAFGADDEPHDGGARHHGPHAARLHSGG